MSDDDGRLAGWGEGLVQQVIEFGLNGGGPLSGAVEVAEEHLSAAGGDREEAIRRLVSTHLRLAAASGFVTGLGGLATLPVTVTASLGGLCIIATRMCAGIAHLRGYDVSTEEVRSAVLVCLLGSAGVATLRRAGVEIGKKSTAAALQKVSGRVLIEIKKRVGYRLVAKVGERGMVNLTKLVPLVGGPIGATVDVASCRVIANYALSTFEPRSTVVHPADAVVIDAEVVQPGAES